MLATDSGNERAARALIPIYERDEKHDRLPALYEVIFAHAEDDATRLAIIETLRNLAVERLSDDSSAYRYAARAFEFSHACIRSRRENRKDASLAR